jgi:hypothetical protein
VLRLRAEAADATTAHLAPIEWQLLEALVSNPGNLVSQRQPNRTHQLITEPGMGYRFQP